MPVDIAKRIPEIREMVRLYFTVYENCSTNQDFFDAFKGMRNKITDISVATHIFEDRITEEELIKFYDQVVSQMTPEDPWGN